jgi:hypothetical protein
MAARRAVRQAEGDPGALAAARGRVEAAKRALGERGPVWWTDGAPDYNRQMVKDTPYAAWFEALSDAVRGSGGPRRRTASGRRNEKTPPGGAGSDV